MSDNISFDMQKTPWDFDLDYDFDQWVDPELLNCSFSENPDSAASNDLIDWNAGIPDALGSSNAGPISGGLNLTRTDDDALHSSAALGGDTLGERVCEAERPIPISSVHHGRMAATSTRVGECLHAAEPLVQRQIPGQTLKKRGRRPQLDKYNDFKCINCEGEITFSRRSDLQRHIRITHSRGANESFVCRAQGCFRGQSPWSFTRSDKLTAHIRTTHHQMTVFSQCPIENCNFGPHTLEDVGVHIQRVHHDESNGRAVLNATSCKALRCPIWRCGKHVSAVKLLHHVTTHAKEEIEAANQSLELAGLLVQFTPGCDVTIQIVCPLCRIVSASIEQFTAHLLTEHLYAPQSGGPEHFEQWKIHLTKSGFATGVTAKTLPWSPVGMPSMFRPRRGIQCPSCPFSVDGDGREAEIRAAIREHHLSLLRPETEAAEEIYPRRMQILRLWPEFATHPVFADLDHPKQQNGSVPSGARLSSASYADNDFGVAGRTSHTVNRPQPFMRPFDGGFELIFPDADHTYI